MATCLRATMMDFLFFSFLRIEDIIQPVIRFAAQTGSYPLQLSCVLCLLAGDHPRDVRQHDPWSNGWHIMALLILFLTSYLSANFLEKLIYCASEFAFVKLAEFVVMDVIIPPPSSSAPRDLYKGSVKRNNYSRSRPGNSVSRPPQELELVKLVDKLLVKLWAHIINGGTDQKAYKKSRTNGTDQKACKKSRTTHPGKHGHNVRSIAFRIWAHSTIQDDLGSPDPSISSVSSLVQMTSPPPQTPPPPTAPPQTPQSPTPTLQVQLTQTLPPPPTAPPQTPQSPTPTATRQVQPPTPTATPPPPPPPPPPRPPPTRAVGWFNFNFAGWFNFNFTSLAKIFLVISTTLVLAPPQILYNAGNSLSANDKTLLFGTKLFGMTGFILCFLAYNIRQDNIAAKLLTAFGCVANIFGLLLIVALGR